MRIRHWDITFVFSLFCSLLINSGMVGMVVLHTQPPKVIDLSNWRPRPAAAQASQAQAFAPPDDPPDVPQPPKKVELDNRQEFGETGGVGQALNSSPGDLAMLSQLGPQVQAFLGRNRPSAGGGGGNGGQGGAQTLIGAASPAETAPPRVKTPIPKIDDTDAPSNPEVAAQTEPPKPLAAAKSQRTDRNQPGRPGAPGRPGPPGPANSTPDTAPPSDRDSDPFSDANSFRFVNGRVLARNGRQVRTVKPHLTDAGMVDAETLPNPAVTFLATIDTQGNVVRVVRYRTSGSDNIDLPCEEALNQWWIEPSKDRNGRPVPDVVSITFALY